MRTFGNTSSGAAMSSSPNRHLSWRWVAVLAAVGLIGLPIAAAGALGTQYQEDACIEIYEDLPFRGDGRFHAFEDKWWVPGIVMHCKVLRHGGGPIERTYVNWEGAIGAGFFLIGFTAASAGILGLVDPRRAALITATCVVVCLAAVVIWFA